MGWSRKGGAREGGPGLDAVGASCKGSRGEDATSQALLITALYISHKLLTVF